MSLADILLEPCNLSYRTAVDGLAVTTYQRKKKNTSFCFIHCE